MKHKFFRLIILLMLIFCSNLFAIKRLPNFSLEDIDGNKVKSSELLGKGPIILDFWATFCGPCMKELPELNNLQMKYDTLITIVCISVDKPKSLSSAKAIIKSKKYSFITLFDTNKEVQNLFNVKSIPRIFVFDKHGNMVYDHTGYKKGDEENLENELIKMLSDTLTSPIVRQMVKTPKFVVFDENPIPIKKVQPEYSREVILQIEVFEDGTVGAVEVIKSLQSGPNGLDEAAIKAVKHWKFIPAKYQGKPVAVWVTIPIKFF